MHVCINMCVYICIMYIYMNEVVRKEIQKYRNTEYTQKYRHSSTMLVIFLYI